MFIEEEQFDRVVEEVELRKEHTEKDLNAIIDDIVDQFANTLHQQVTSHYDVKGEL